MTKASAITIRRATAADAADVTSIYQGPAAMAGTFQLPYPAESTWAERLANPAPGTWLLAAEVEGRVVGLAGLHGNPGVARRNHAASIGIGVHDAWQGRGVGTALMRAIVDLADNWLNVLRLELSVYGDNEAARRLYERFGFVEEGRFRAYAYRNGEFVDAIAMARVREEAKTPRSRKGAREEETLRD